MFAKYVTMLFAARSIGPSMGIIILLWKVSKKEERGELFLERDDVSAY